MKMSIVLLVLCLVGCGCVNHNDPKIMSENKTTLATAGQEVGVLPDGRKVIRYEIDMGISHNHWIYVTDGSISMNHTVSVDDDSTTNEVQVIIEGKKYNLSPIIETHPDR